MRHCKSVLALTGALSTMLLGGCKSDDLDLGDIDTTMQIEVNDLVLPVNLAPIVFDDMVDLSDTEGIEIINGEYVLLKEGTFESEEINIREIPEVNAKIDMDAMQPVYFPVVGGNTRSLPSFEVPFSYTHQGVDKYIKDITSGKVNLTLTFKITAKEGTKPMDCEFQNMEFELPKGFYGDVSGTMYPTGEGVTIKKGDSNVVPVPDAKPSANGEYVLNYYITSFEFHEIDEASLVNELLHISANFGLKSGDIKIINGNGQQGSLDFQFAISPLEVKTFSGKVYYELDNLDPQAITLDDLPDVLTDPNTHLGLKNPQLYVTLSNPLWDKGVTASTGLTLFQQRPGVEIPDSAYLANRLVIAATEGVQNFCLSPINPEGKIYDKFPGAKWELMDNLGNIVNGDGLPQGLDIKFKDPKMNESDVTDFNLGANLGRVTGEYTFYAPIELSEGSSIYYEEEARDWDLGGDDNQLDIKSISLTADCVSDLPVNVTITAHPLNSEGELINDLEIAPAKVTALSSSPIEIIIKGNIKDLDGMRYNVLVDAGQKTDVLKPTMTLKLNNLKLKVSGSYIIDSNDDDNE